MPLLPVRSSYGIIEKEKKYKEEEEEEEKL